LSTDVTTLHVSPLTETWAFADTIQGVNLALASDGGWLAVRSQEREDKLTLLPVQSQGETWVVPSRSEETYSFIVDNIAWSPDGSRLAFTGFSWEVGEMIHIVDVRAHLEWNIPVYMGNRIRFAHFLSWPPDGNALMFAARNENTRKDNLYVVNVDGSNLRNLSRDEDLYVRAPTWSPDGHYVFYSEYSDQDFTRRPRLIEVTSR